MTNLLLVIVLLCLVCLAYIATHLNSNLKWLISHSKGIGDLTRSSISRLEEKIEVSQARTDDAIHRAIFEFTTAQGQLEAERRLLRQGPVEYHGRHYAVQKDYKSDQHGVAGRLL